MLYTLAIGMERCIKFLVGSLVAQKIAVSSCTLKAYV
jgi:hypothetical protein